jgi:hypothetical protein
VEGIGAEPSKVLSYDDELFSIPDHLRIEKPEITEGNVTASASMLTAIPEVSLGPEYVPISSFVPAT